MKEFNKWWYENRGGALENFELDKKHSFLAWKAALEWVKDKLNCEICPGDIEYFIDKELKE